MVPKQSWQHQDRTNRLVKAARKSPERQELGVGGCPLAEHIRAQSVPS